MEIPFVGPSYWLASRPSGVQRTINLIPVPQEAGNERTGWVFKDSPGLVSFNEPEIVVELTGWDSSNETGTWTFSGSDFTAEVA